MEPEKITMETIIQELGMAEKPLLSARLARLSYLTPDQHRLLEKTWPGIETARRRQIVTRLVELAEDNLELNFDRFMKYLLNDADAEVRNKAIEGLWEAEEPSLIPRFIRLLESDPAEKVRATAATALGRFALLAEFEELEPADAEKVSRSLLAAAADPARPPEVRRRALEAAGALSRPEVKKIIREYYYSDSLPFKASALFAMGRSCAVDWLPLLLGEVTNEAPELRYEVAGALGEIGERDAVPALIRLAGDPDTDVRLAVMQALGRVGGREAKTFLQTQLSSPSEAVRQTAEEALGEMDIMQNPLSFGGLSDREHTGEEDQAAG